MTAVLPRPTFAVEGQTEARSVAWGAEDELGSAAFWVAQTRAMSHPDSHRLGRTLLEEAAACLLGGHGVTGVMTMAVFEAVRDAGALDPCVPMTEARLYKLLCAPVDLPDGRRARYRFPGQRAARLTALREALPHAPEGADGRTVRDWLVTLPGFGPKTASWAARNYSGAEDLAVIDIHIDRAGTRAGVFEPTWRLPRDYALYEDAFLAWAHAGGVRASDLDACIWYQLSGLSWHARKFLDLG